MVWKVVALMTGTLMSFIGMAVAARQLSHSMGTFEILSLRSVVGVVVLFPLAFKHRHEIVASPFRGLQLIRNVVHFSAQYFWTLGLTVLPLTEVFALEFTMPIWVALIAVTILRERINASRLTAVIGGFIGVLIILRPGTAGLNPAAFLVLLAALGFGTSVIMVKIFTRSVSSLTIIVWMTIVQLPMGFLFSIFNWSPVSLADLPWILLIGVTGLSAHYFMAQALRLADATIVLPIDFLRVPLSVFVGLWLYGEKADPWIFVGAAIIFLSNYYSVLKESQVTKAVSH